MPEYAEFLKDILPTILVLLSSETEFHPGAYSKTRRGPAERTISSRYGVSRVEEDYFDIVATYEFVMRSVPSTETESSTIEVPIRIVCKFEGHFHAKAPVDRGFAEQYCRRDSWLIFWPYFRQFVSDATARMSIPAELLPLGLGAGDFSRRTAAKSPKPQLTDGARKAIKRIQETRKQEKNEAASKKSR